jgi:hypothetical protein
MQSTALQQMVKKIFGDEATKAQFTASPESVISKFALTKEEIKAVLSTHKMGLMTGNSQTLEATIVAKSGWDSPVP